MQLCIDWGNTRVKAGLFESDQLLKDFNWGEEESLTQIMELVREHRPQAVLLCAVASYPPELKALLQEHTRLWVLNGQTALPLLNAYHSPETLGMDRVALAVGGQSRFPDQPVLAISLGTAITYNFVLGNRIFRGGGISPGMRTRFASLHEHAEKLPLVDERGELLLLGYDTETSIRSGVIFGMCAEIDGMIAYYQEQYKGTQAVLTGGDASFFAGKLKSQIFADPQLLLRGLNTILLHNVR